MLKMAFPGQDLCEGKMSGYKERCWVVKARNVSWKVYQIVGLKRPTFLLW
jgi:hypothetical protein